ncbi:MAG: type II/IV secretion system protein [Armatimonadetes bacterium]|nr:type II/IV secretion system protein [Armatimonadota bacterium]
MEEQNEEGLYTLDEAVQFLGTSKPTLYRLLSQGDLKGLKVGRQWRFRKADLIAYMERGPVAVAAAPPDVLDGELAAIADQLRQVGQEMTEIRDPEMDDGERKTVQLAHSIMKLALAQYASDIHLEPARLDGENVSLLRLRVDGVLHEIRRMAFPIHEGLIARFKIMAEMNVNEHRLPQDGRISVRHEDKDFDFRASIIPAMYGEAVTIRILARNDVLIGLDKIGLTVEDGALIQRLIQKPNGLLLVAGPSGSGKTTTVYSCLEAKACPEVKTLTIEDPVEYLLPYTTQMQVNKNSGLTFPAGLRSLMRQDPDVIYVGEIRDLEATKIAAEASLTGHLVLTTLHTNDAPSALSRLLELGLEPHLISATVIGVVAQRLCRKICEQCKESYRVAARDLLRFGLEPDTPDQTITLYRGRGCERCRQRGYFGRTAIFEILELTEEIRDLIIAHAPQTEIAAAAQAAGMNTLRQAGLLKVLDGVTTPDEVMRVISTSV